MVSPTLPVSPDRFSSHLRLGSFQEKHHPCFLCYLAPGVLLPDPAMCAASIDQSADSSKIPPNGASWKPSGAHSNVPGTATFLYYLRHRKIQVFVGTCSTDVRREKTTWQQGRGCVSSPSLQPAEAVAAAPGLLQLTRAHRANLSMSQHSNPNSGIQ